MKTKFSVKVDGKDVELAVRTPTSEEKMRAKIEYNKAVRKAIEEKHILRPTLNNYMREQGLWNDEMEKKDRELADLVAKQVRTLQAGGMNLNEAKKLALEIKENRSKQIEHRAVANKLDNITAEAFGEEAQFDFYVSTCTVYNDSGEPYFKGVDDYREKSATETAVQAATNLMNLLYDFTNLQESLPENKFLKRFKFVDDKLRLINKEGHLVDEEGRLIDENGRYVDKDGAFVNIRGEKVNEEGDLLIEPKPFYDDDGKPIE